METLVGLRVRVRWGGRYYVNGEARERTASGTVLKQTKGGRLRILKDNADQCSRREINAKLADVICTL